MDRISAIIDVLRCFSEEPIGDNIDIRIDQQRMASEKLKSTLSGQEKSPDDVDYSNNKSMIKDDYDIDSLFKECNKIDLDIVKDELKIDLKNPDIFNMLVTYKQFNYAFLSTLVGKISDVEFIDFNGISVNGKTIRCYYYKVLRNNVWQVINLYLSSDFISTDDLKILDRMVTSSLKKSSPTCRIISFLIADIDTVVMKGSALFNKSVNGNTFYVLNLEGVSSVRKIDDFIAYYKNGTVSDTTMYLHKFLEHLKDDSAFVNHLAMYC